MKKRFLLMAFAALITGFAFTACSDDNTKDDNGGNEGGDPSAFVLTVTWKDANYMLTTDDLTQGSITTVGTGKETETGTYWVYYDEEYLFRLAYNQGSAGVSSSYELNDQGRIIDRDGIYEIKRFTSYGLYDDYLITTSTGALNASNAETISGENYIPKGFLINYLNMDTESIGSNAEEIWSEDYLGNGEFVTFAGVLQVGSRIFTAPIPMGMSHWGVVVNEDKIKYPQLVKTESGGTNSGAYTAGELQWTQYPDEAWIAIYNDRSFSAPAHLIKTDKISYACGRSASQYYQMIWAADNGDVYVFSPSYAKSMSEELQQTSLPAGVVRIKSGANEFDDSYYVDIEEQSDGCGFLRTWHIGEDYFLLMMYDRPFTETGFVATRLAIFKGETGQLTYVNSGMPAADAIASFGNQPYFDNGKVYIPIVVAEQDPAVYVIDAATATATKGISVAGATAITSVGKLTYKE